MIKSILVPMGTSEISICSLKTAVSLSNLFKAALYLLYVEDEAKVEDVITSTRAPGPGSTAGVEGMLIKEVRKELEKEKEIALGYYENIKEKIEGKHEFIVKKGYVTDEIMKASKVVDLVVMGKSRKKDIQKSISRVIQKSNKPMVAVSETVTLGDNILIAYDGSLTANNSIRVLGDFIPALSPKITLLTINNSEEKANAILEEAEKYLLPYEVEVEKVWKEGSVSENIIETVKEKNVTAVVMGGYGDNKIKEFFLGSTAKKILNNINIPVIVANM